MHADGATVVVDGTGLGNEIPELLRALKFRVVVAAWWIGLYHSVGYPRLRRNFRELQVLEWKGVARIWLVHGSEAARFRLARKRRPRERPSPCIADTSALLPWQFIEFVRCHIHLNGIADVVEFIIGDRDHVAIQTENATDFDRDGDFAARSGQHAMNRAKAASV
jgi:hypothetical protein